MIREFVFISGFVSLFAAAALGGEESVLARVTVYWPGEGQLRASWNGARLRAGHCAVDPDKIPYGSKVYFPDGPCVAVDTGPAVINRKAARLSGHNASQRNALVIDRFFESKEQALAWERAHPHFMTVRVTSRGSSPHAHPPSLLAERPATVRAVAQTSVPLPVVPMSAPPPSIAIRENDLPAMTMLRTAGRAQLSIPPSYHRRRFAAFAKEETEVPPPTCTIRPLKRSRIA
jgi:3D (Asp-Asp-Asp) domain-containing protein